MCLSKFSKTILKAVGHWKKITKEEKLGFVGARMVNKQPFKEPCVVVLSKYL